MPLKSKAQEKYLWANDPKLAQEFEDKTPKSAKKGLPEHVAKKNRKVDNWQQPPLVLNTGSRGIVCNLVTTMPVSDNPKPPPGKTKRKPPDQSTETSYEETAGEVQPSTCPNCGKKLKGKSCPDCNWANP